MDEDIHVRQHGTMPSVLVKGRSSHYVMHFNESERKQICLRLTGMTNEWYDRRIFNIFLAIH